MKRLALSLAAIAWWSGSPAENPAKRVLDDFSHPSGWTASPSEAVQLTLSSDSGERGPALRLDFDFAGHAGWAAIRKRLPLRFPRNWAFHLRLRGQTPSQTLEFKLLDPSGQNVWWSVRRDFEFPREWTTLTIPKRRVSFAWGPARGGELAELGFVEIAITAASGGKGTVWLEELSFEELPEPPSSSAPIRPRASASSSAQGHPPEASVDADAATEWRSGPGEEQQLTLDLGASREFGGLVLDWDAEDYPRHYEVLLSEDGARWTTRREVRPKAGGRAFLSLTDSQARYLRLALLRSSRGRGYALAEVSVRPPSFADTPTAFLESVARESPRGWFPRSLVGEQLYWTLAGGDGSRDPGLFSEDGALEVGRGAFSIEPFIWFSGRLLDWSNAAAAHSLERGDLPIPTATLRYPGGLELEVTALADGPPEATTLRARYRLRNASGSRAQARLFLAIRPVQVNPPWQFLNVPGGFAPIRTIRRDGSKIRLDSRRLVAGPRPSEFGATSFDSGEISSWLARGELPRAAEAEDTRGFASAALAWDVELPDGGWQDVALSVLPGGAEEEGPGSASSSDPAADFPSRLARARAEWERKVDRVGLEFPGRTAALAAAVRSSVGWILVNRDGPAIQPGSRAYSRSWIRDGALTSAALLRLGHAEEVREFLRWYAPHEFPSGKVPCCVDRRGADPVAENDSHGELIFLAAEYLRMTRDRETIEEVWPLLEKAAAFIDALRRERRTPEYARPEKRIFFGLLPESISHEGYSARPVHSYWDDFWALRGLEDAAEIAKTLGREADARRFSSWRDELRTDLHASIREVITRRRIDYIPGSAELADFDATSTTIALAPGREGPRLPRRELLATFERYWRSFQARRRGTAHNGEEAYTPYEWRIVGTFVRLGWRERARQLADFFLADRRPLAWNEWAEVVWRNPRAPKFIGDMPHGWVASDFIRSATDMLAYERDEDDALVLAAGVPAEWLREGPVAVSDLRTRWGSLSYRLSRDGPVLRLRVSDGLTVPPGGVVLKPPLEKRPRRVTVDGRAVRLLREELVLRRLPAEVSFEW